MSMQHLTLDNDAGLPNVGDLRDRLLDALTPDGVVQLDLSAVADAHLCIIQLIEAARRHAAGIGAAFTLAAPVTPALARTLARAGFSPKSPDDIAFWLHGDSVQ